MYDSIASLPLSICASHGAIPLLGYIMTVAEKAQAMLGSPVGCALILDVSENLHLPLEFFAEPKVSF